MEEQFEIRTDLLLEIINEANGKLDNANYALAKSVYNLCLDAILKESSVLKRKDLEQEIISIEWGLPNNPFIELEKIFGYGEGMFAKVADYTDDLIEEIFTLAFTEGFKTMQRIAEGRQ